MKAAIHGDFGISLKERGRTVAEIIQTKFPVSARIGGIAVLLALAIGIPLGSVAALHRGKAADKVIIVFSTCGIAVPSFVIYTVMRGILGYQLRWSQMDIPSARRPEMVGRKRSDSEGFCLQLAARG